jgi:hypothetical protein
MNKNMILSQNEKTVTMALPIEPRYFGMFTDEGNNAVAFIVDYNRANNNDWPTVYQNLQDLAESDPERYGEANDTVVRELVYDACQFTSDFYI